MQLIGVKQPKMNFRDKKRQCKKKKKSMQPVYVLKIATKVILHVEYLDLMATTTEI